LIFSLSQAFEDRDFILLRANAASQDCHNLSREAGCPPKL